MPADIYTHLATAIITAVVTLLAVYLTNRNNTNRLMLQLEHERKSRQTELHVEKLEELYILAVKYNKLLHIYAHPYIMVMEGRLDYNQAHDMTINRGKEDSPDYDRLQMLIDLFFPKLRTSLKQLVMSRERMNDILGEHKSAYHQGIVDGSKFIQPMRSALKNIDNVGEQLMNDIIEQLKTI